ncbi:hypothetical protein V8D89_015963 [Ganoderma adspersum]
MAPVAQHSVIYLALDWAYQAYPDTPIPGGHRLDVPFRDPRFPIFWEVNCHPKLSTDAVAEKCLVYWQNTNPVIMRALHTYLKTIKIPEGTKEKIQVASNLFINIIDFNIQHIPINLVGNGPLLAGDD